VQTVLEDGSIVLDKTLLYPEGGGQPADHGTLEKGGVTFQVIDVQKVGDIVVHKLENELVKAAGGFVPGDRVTGRVDMRRRLAHARHHTATHLVHDSAKRVLGKHIWQPVPRRARTGLVWTYHTSSAHRAELKAIELEANRRVMEVYL